MRPYRKWSLPPVDLSSSETDLWSDLCSGRITLDFALESLKQLRESGQVGHYGLSMRSMELIAMDNTEKMAKFIEDMK